MVSVSQSDVNKVQKLTGEATTKAECIYRGQRSLFPGVEVGMYKEASMSLAAMGGAISIDVTSLLDGIFFDTVVVSGFLPAVQTRGKKVIRWGMGKESRDIINKAFVQQYKGVSYSIKSQERMPRDDKGLVLFTLVLKTANVSPVSIWDMVKELNTTGVLQDGYLFKLVDVDITVNVPGHVKAGFNDDMVSLFTGNGVELKPSQYERKVGLQCPSWSGTGLYFKVYNKLAFMLVAAASNNGYGGSQLTNILKSGHNNIHNSFRDKNIQENGFSRAELRFTASSLPETLEQAKDMLVGLLVKAAPQCLVALSLDKMVSKYRAVGHRELLLLEEQSSVDGGCWKVVVVRWMDKITGHFNSQSTSSAGLDGRLPETLEAAVHLGYQWVSGDVPVVAVVVKDGQVVQSVKLPKTGRVADIEWDSRKAAESQMVSTKGRGISFEEVGMPSFWMEHPKKRLVVAVEHSSGWWGQAKKFELGSVLNKKQLEAKAREWAKVQNKQARYLLEDMLTVGCPRGAKLGKRLSLDAVKAKALLVVKTEKDKFGKYLFLASDGNTYEFSKRMRDAGQHLLVASRECPLVFVRGAAGKQKTAQGFKQYPDAVMYAWGRKAAQEVSKELDALFYTAEEFELYADVKM